MISKISFFITLFIFTFILNSNAQEKQYKVGCIAFYNMENLYDTVNDPNKNDEEFLPEGKNKWFGKRYKEKIIHMSEVISQIGDEYVKGGPVIVGLSEVENKNVVVDLTQAPALKNSEYDVVHYDSPDKRGVDVALIYRKKHFQVTNSKKYTLKIAGKDDFFTRDQLLVSGKFDGEQMHFIVNHWPSRRGGEKRSAPLRNEAAKLCRSIVDSIMKVEPNAKVVIMGDLNDDPTNESVMTHLNVKTDASLVQPGDLYNPAYKLYKDGIGSLAYRDSWNLFDQVIVSSGLVGEDKSSYKFVQAKIFNRKFLTQSDGAFAGYPFRTYVGGAYTGGYSDHFPSYIFIMKEKQ